MSKFSDAGWNETLLKEWEREFPEGTAVVYWPDMTNKHHVETHIRSAPWMIPSSKIPLVKIAGRAGGVLVTHIQRDLSRPAWTPPAGAPPVSRELTPWQGASDSVSHLVAIGDHTFVLASIVHIGPVVSIERAINPASYAVVGYQFAVTGVGYSVNVECLGNIHDLYGLAAQATLELAHTRATTLHNDATQAVGRHQRGK